MLWQDGEQISLFLEQTFNHILMTRMQDIPLLNSVLRVQSVGFVQVNQEWLGILITPWFMNLLLFPGADSDWIAQSPGSQFERVYPYASFEFTIANEARLGAYGLCSLFSPMFQFADQAAALAAAQSALQALLASQAPRAISRRDLLRGNLGNL